VRRATAIKAKPDDVEFFDDIEQRSDAWHDIRRGIPTASKFSVIMASGKDGEDSVGRQKLLYVMAGEILTGETADSFRNEAMERGLQMEPEARAYYGRSTFSTLMPMGFVKRTIHNHLGTSFSVGASPDSLVDQDGVLEIKTTRPDLLIPILKRGAAGLPSVHKAQCHGTLWVTGRSWCDLLIYYRGMPKAKFRIERDESYITKIKNAVEVFSYELGQLVAEMRKLGLNAYRRISKPNGIRPLRSRNRPRSLPPVLEDRPQIRRFALALPDDIQPRHGYGGGASICEKVEARTAIGTDDSKRRGDALMADPRQEVMIDYTNWRGERSLRRVRPLQIDFENNEWHPETQWLLLAIDVEKGEPRTFAMKNIHSWFFPAALSATQETEDC